MKSKMMMLSFALALPMAVQAQAPTQVTLYGTIDTAIDYVNNIYDMGTGEKNSSVHFTTLTASVPSHWGLRGSEDLGSGLSAIFALESGFNPGTGVSNQGERLFGRQAWVGLKGDWGQVAFGRQYTMLMWGLMGADVLGPNSQGMASFDSYLSNARMDNSITYRGNFDGLKFGAAYARGRDTVAGANPAATGCGVDYADQTACSAWSAMLGYDAANWGVAAVYDAIRGSGEAVPTNWNGLLRDQQDRRWSINGYVKFDAAKVGLLYLNRKNDAGLSSYAGSLGDRSDLWTLNASYQLGPSLTLDGAINYIRYKDAGESSKAWLYVARATYSFSKRTAAYTSVGYMRNKGYAASSASGGTAGRGYQAEAGGNQTSVMVGLRHRF